MAVPRANAGFTPPDHLALGPITVYFYSLFILLGLLLGYYLVRPIGKRASISADQLQLSIFYGVVPGLIGSRLYHVIDQWGRYAADPIQIFAVWQGGLGIFGGLLGGAIGLTIFARRQRIPFLKLLDTWAPGMLLAQAIGRFGNWTNQEAFGPPTSGPTGIFIDPAHRPPQFAEQSHFHPTFFYEAGLDLIGLALLLAILRPARRTHRPGTVLGAYLIIFGIVRFTIEFYRIDTAQIAGLPAAQLLAIGCILLGLYLVTRRATAPARRSARRH